MVATIQIKISLHGVFRIDRFKVQVREYPAGTTAKVIIEAGLPNYRIDPSQGTHFFQNLTSFRVGYLTLNPYANDGHFDIDYLDKLWSVCENEFLRHIHFKEPLVVKIDGKKNLGLIMEKDKVKERNLSDYSEESY